jgi:hypothetical protein
MPADCSEIFPRYGIGRPAKMGRTLTWYDGPVCFEVDDPELGPALIAQLVPDRPGWINTAVGIHLKGKALDYARAQRADMRMLMTRPEASLWRVDFIHSASLLISPILDPLPDEMIPDTGLYLSDFDEKV